MDAYPSTARMLMLARSQAKSVVKSQNLLGTTPVHEVTFAEDLRIPDSSHSYDIELPTPSSLVVLSLAYKTSESATANSALYAAAVYTNDDIVRCSKSDAIHKTYDMAISVILSALYGFGDITISSGRQDTIGTQATTVKTSINSILPAGTKIKTVKLWVSNDHYLWAGTTLKVYAANEV